MMTVLVDASGLIYQGFHASKKQEDHYRLRSDGFPVAAVREFTRRIWTLVFDGLRGFKPDHIGIIFDYDGPTFRRQLYADYKGGRERPSELQMQLPVMREVAEAFGCVAVEADGFEADDLIATYTRLAREEGHEVIIVTFDKDMYQLVKPGVTVFCPAVGDPRFTGFRQEKWVSQTEVVDKFGVPPSQVVDVQALMGDATDRVPGVPKIGEKTAADLIRQFGSAEAVITFADQIFKPKLRDSIKAHAEDIRLSRQLVSLLDDVDLPVPLHDLVAPSPDAETLLRFFEKMEFVTWARRTRERFGLVAEGADETV